MAKSLSVDQLEALLSTVIAKSLPDVLMKVLEKFEACLNRLADKFEAKLDKVYGDMHDTNVRIDQLESKLAVLEKVVSDQPRRDAVAVNTSSRHSQSAAGVDLSLQALMAMEVEKMERSKRQRNVIITGLPQSQDMSDEDSFLKFCEEHLTVKPRPILTQRIGKPTTSGVPRRLRVTFDSDAVAADLISSSQLLRDSHNDMAKKVYINRDLTPMEAQLAYDSRQLKRSSGTTSRVHEFIRGTASSS